MGLFIGPLLAVFVLSSTPGCATTQALDMSNREKLPDMVHPGDEVEITTVTGYGQRITVKSIDGKTIKGQTIKGDSEEFELAQVARTDKVVINKGKTAIVLGAIILSIVAVVLVAGWMKNRRPDFKQCAAEAECVRLCELGARVHEGSRFQRVGIPTLVRSPDPIAQAHQPNVYATLDQFSRCHDFLRRLTVRMCRT